MTSKERLYKIMQVMWEDHPDQFRQRGKISQLNAVNIRCDGAEKWGKPDFTGFNIRQKCSSCFKTVQTLFIPLFFYSERTNREQEAAEESGGDGESCAGHGG